MENKKHIVQKIRSNKLVRISVIIILIIIVIVMYLS